MERLLARKVNVEFVSLKEWQLPAFDDDEIYKNEAFFFTITQPMLVGLSWPARSTIGTLARN